jgi:hypothetical protein
MVGERRLEEVQVQRSEELENSQRVLGSPAANVMDVFKKHGPLHTGALGCPCRGISWACPTSGNTYTGFYCSSVSDQRRPDSESRTMESTDGNWFGAIVYYGALIAHVKVVRVLRSFNLAIGRSGRARRGLKDTNLYQ